VSLPAIAAPYLAATVVLAAAGAAKTVRPAETVNALRQAGLPGRVVPVAVRVGAAGEVVLAVAAVLAPGALTGGLVAAAYTGFAVFVVLAWNQGWALSSCGCFGRPDTPPTVLHAVLNVGAAVSAVWWAAAWGVGDGFHRLGHLLVHEPWHGAPLVLLIAVLAGLAYLIWTNPVPAARR
jgi:hypothetical protein